MNQFACEHPVKIKNPYNGQWLYVPCQKCDMCRSSKAARWTERLEFERSCHPYCLFGTLTYSDSFLPRYQLLDDGLLDESTGELVLFNELEDYYDTDSKDYIKSLGFLPVGKVEDVQRFIKRLREKVRIGKCGSLPYSCDRPESRYIRYFLVEEISETTYRPHYHFLIFTSSKWLATHAKDVVASCWSTDNRYTNTEQLGIVDVQNVQTSASSYVSSYINSFTDCPKIYRFSKFRPFKIFSKHPPLGTFLPSSKEIQTLFSNGSPTMSVYRRKDNKFHEIPIPKSLCDRIYPKVTGFDLFPSDVIARLYSQDIDFSQMSFKDFREFARRRSEGLDKGYSSELQRYYQYLFLNTTKSESNLHHVFSCLRRVSLQSAIFGVSKSVYIDRIFKFYQSQDYYRLRSFYEYYEEYSKTHEIKEMLLNDRVYIDFIRSDSDLYVEFLKTYGYDEKTCSTRDFLDSISQENNEDFIDACSKARKCINDSRKKKAKNEYLVFRNMSNFKFKSYLINKHGLSKHYEGVVESVTHS